MLNISLPDPVQRFVEDQAIAAGFNSANEYVYRYDPARAGAQTGRMTKRIIIKPKASQDLDDHFDSLYYYRSDRPVHISYAPQQRQRL